LGLLNEYNVSVKYYTKLSQFRSLMNQGISSEESLRIWGKDFSRGKGVRNENKSLEKKIKIAKQSLSVLLMFNLVKFIGISGSVGSGFAKEEDDIDIFVVTRDGTMWLYRALVQVRNVFHRKIRLKEEEDVKDKLCLNLIAEERGLTFDSDIFNFNELMYLIPIYNEKYLKYIYSQNEWLSKKYGMKEENMITDIKPQKQVNLLFRILNTLLYLFQLIYMKLARHRPDIERIHENSKRGRIEFFPKRFRERKIKNYLKEFKSIN